MSIQKFNWQEAVDFCRNLDFAGLQDWRLPTVDEMATLPVYSKYAKVEQSEYPFLNIQLFHYWTSSTCDNDPTLAWGIANGYSTKGVKNVAVGYVCPVREGYPGLFSFDYEIRFSDNQDGTITDNHTGLIWIKDLNSI